jgi:hypothetical protein
LGKVARLLGGGNRKKATDKEWPPFFFLLLLFFFFSKRLYQTKEESICFACEEPMTSFPDEEKIIAKPPFSARCQSK